MKKSILLLILSSLFLFSCNYTQTAENKTAQEEQSRVEKNQSKLNAKQPSPMVEWSLERDNLINRFNMMNDQSVVFYMYVFNYGIAEPIGYYQVNKVSSVNSQLTNPNQIVSVDRDGIDRTGIDELAHFTLPSPAEDGSYGTNGNAIFGFTPDEIYIEHNMQYICSSATLNFKSKPNALLNINVKDLEELKTLTDKIDGN